VEDIQPSYVRQVISKETSAIMRNLIISVVEEGTGKNAKVVGYTIGGKTGTSEKIDEFNEWGGLVDDKIVSFAGIAFDENDEAKYICLVALDTPGPGQYISGGVMAAPTVGDIFMDVLPYLGLNPNYTEDEIGLINFTMPNCKGMNLKDASEILAEKNLTYRVIGGGEKVTGQIPAAGSPVPGNSEVSLYMDADVPTGNIAVPDFHGLTVEQAKARAAYAGLYLQSRGTTSSSGSVSVSSQDIEPGTEVARGTTITVKFTDSSALD
jgi:stage V sporulation protein D (sporulation-specific penicillin-binding protein)